MSGEEQGPIFIGLFSMMLCTTHLGVTAGELDGVELALPPLASVESVPVWLLLRRIFLGVL